MAPEKYEAPEVEFVEMEEEDVVSASSCPEHPTGVVIKDCEYPG